MIRKLDTPTEA